MSDDHTHSGSNDNKKGAPGDLTCNFCDKSGAEVSQMIDAGEAQICDECTEAAFELVQESRRVKGFNLASSAGLPTPKEIRDALQEYVVGQEEAKKDIAIAVHSHYLRLHVKENKKPHQDDISKSNLLMVGPTGSGKTYLLRTLAKVLDVPFIIADATSLTEAGYVGDDVESILVNLLSASDYDIAKAQRGIVYIDEIDKIASQSAGPSVSKDVGGKGVQHALLKLIEGTVANVPPKGGRKNPNQEMLQINTDNILFVVGGAFTGIEQIVAQRLENATEKKAGMGFGAEIKMPGDEPEYTTNQLRAEITRADLISFGMTPELLGRLQVQTSLEQLSPEDMVVILSEPKNNQVEQAKAFFEVHGVAITFDDDALLAIGQKAFAMGTGARALQSIMEETLREVKFEVPGDETVAEIQITRETVESKGQSYGVTKREVEPVAPEAPKAVAAAAKPKVA